MGYSKHIIKITPVEQATQENYQRIVDAIGHYSFRYHDGIIDDATWNDGDGTKWYEFYDDIYSIAKTLPDLIITFQKIGEDHYYSWDENASDDIFTVTLNGENIVDDERDLTNDEIDTFEDLYERTADIQLEPKH